jgi:NADH:ubiquinone oxidoreductase subunit K
MLTESLVLSAILFVIGTFGHIIKSRTLVAVGIALVFAATVALPLALALSN